MPRGDLRDSIWRSGVSSFIGILFLGSFALGAALMIWQTASGENPIANTLAKHLTAQTEGY